MSKLNLNQPISVTKKSIFIYSAVTILLFLFSISSLIISLSNSGKISGNYQVVAASFNELENKVNASNTMMENISALEHRINEVELDQKKITVDYDNLNTRTARHEQDIFLLQTIVNDKNLDSRLDNIEVSLKNNEIDIDSIKTVQRTQQISLDDIANAFIEFKSMIIQKITTMLTTKKSSSSNSAEQTGKVTKVSNFPYVLSSIEYRSGEKWAVFSPKNIKFLSELKFISLGNMIDNWTVSQIENQSVKLVNGKQVYSLTVAQ